MTVTPRNVSFHPDALAEATEAAAYYGERVEQLGSEFIAELRRVVALVAERPDTGAPMRARRRRWLFRRFQFALVYRIAPDAVARRHAGQVLGDVLGEASLTTPIYGSAAEALGTACDVFVEYTKPDTAKANILAALDRGAHVVVGTSGLTEADFAEIDVVARRQARGVLACGNFALTVVLLQRFAEKWADAG